MALENLTLNKILDESTREIIKKVVTIIDERQHRLRNPNRYSQHDREVILELDILRLQIIKKFSS